jgi:hypothetical protein
MIYLLDTGPLVAAFRRPQDKDPLTCGPAKLLRSLPSTLARCLRVRTTIRGNSKAADDCRSPKRFAPSQPVRRGASFWTAAVVCRFGG